MSSTTSGIATTTNPPSNESSLRFRKTTRAPLVAPVKLQFDTFNRPRQAFTAEVSAGGMFVRSRRPRPVGTRLRFVMRLEGFEKPAVGFAQVVWVRLVAKDPGQFTGMGLEFRYIDPPSRSRIEAAVSAAVEKLRLEQEPGASSSGVGRRAPDADD